MAVVLREAADRRITLRDAAWVVVVAQGHKVARLAHHDLEAHAGGRRPALVELKVKVSVTARIQRLKVLQGRARAIGVHVDLHFAA